MNKFLEKILELYDKKGFFGSKRNKAKNKIKISYFSFF